MIDHFGWYLTYIQNFYFGLVLDNWGEFNHSWSLAVEQQFYVLFGVLLLVIPTKFYKITFLFVTLASASVYIVLYYYVGGLPAYVLPFSGFVFILSGGSLWLLKAPRLYPYRETAAWLLAVFLVAVACMPGRSAGIWSDYLPVPEPLMTFSLAFLFALFL